MMPFENHRDTGVKAEVPYLRREIACLRAELAAERSANATNICYAKDLVAGSRRDAEEIERLRGALIALFSWAVIVHRATDRGLGDAEPIEFAKVRDALASRLEGKGE
jgi:hypothetical protein